MSPVPENLAKISLLEAIVKNKKKRKKVTEAKHKRSRLKPGGLIISQLRLGYGFRTAGGNDVL